MPIDHNIQAGFVRPYRGRSVEEQEAALLAAGAPVIFYTSKGETVDDALRRLRRKGELLATAGGLRVLGTKRDEIAAAEQKVREKGGAVIDVDTGERSDVDGIPMFHRAIAETNGERRIPNVAKHREGSRKGAQVRARLARNGRLPRVHARRHWRNPLLTVPQALELMTGWTLKTAYRHLGPRDTPAGRRTPDYYRRLRLKQFKEAGGAVYFIRAKTGGPVKIGFATDVDDRLRALQTSHHSELELVNAIGGSYADENALHERFKAYRLKGEWFRLTGALKRYLDKLPALDARPE